MANFSKAFNFRGGFQVDNDVIVVRGPLVGIGSTQPVANLDVRGETHFESTVTSGFSTFQNIRAVGIITGDLVDSAGIVQVAGGIVTARTGVVTYYGDGVNLLNLPTSQWVDVDPGLGFTSIYAQGPVGVSTDDPRFDFQVGGAPFAFRGAPINQDGVGINSAGDIFATGIVSVTGTTGFAGTGTQLRALNASELTVGAIPSNAYGTLIITEEVEANRFIGTADFAANLTVDADTTFSVGTAQTLTALDRFTSPSGKIQLGSDDVDPNVADIEITRTTGSTILSRSPGGFARVFAGVERPEGIGPADPYGYGGIAYGGNNPLVPTSLGDDLDIINYSTGNVNHYLHVGPAGVSNGQFRWFNGESGGTLLASLDLGGQFSFFGNGLAPTINCSGLATFTEIATEFGADIAGNLTVGGDLDIQGTIAIETLALQNAVFAGIVTVGGVVPTQLGIRFSPNGDIESNGTISLFSGTTEETTIAPTSADFGGNVTGAANATFNTGTVSANVLASQSDITGANFSVVAGGIQAESANINNNVSVGGTTTTANLIVTGETNIQGFNAGILTAISIETTALETPSITIPATSTDLVLPDTQVTTLVVGGTATANELVVGGASSLPQIVNLTNIVVDEDSPVLVFDEPAGFAGVSTVSFSTSEVSVLGILTASGPVYSKGGFIIESGNLGIGVQPMPPNQPTTDAQSSIEFALLPDPGGSNDVSLVITARNDDASNTLGITTIALGGSGGSGGGVPEGVILLWSGAIADIPAGWQICDGTNGTPDLRSRFVVGAEIDGGTGVTFSPTTGAESGQYGPNNTGGTTAHQLTIAEMPSHTHQYQRASAPGGGQDQAGSGSGDALNNSNTTTSGQGSNNFHENRPPYYALAYIQKLP